MTLQECHVLGPTPALNKDLIDTVQHYKYSGVWLESKLSYKAKVEHLPQILKILIGFLH